MKQEFKAKGMELIEVYALWGLIRYLTCFVANSQHKFQACYNNDSGSGLTLAQKQKPWLCYKQEDIIQ